MRVLPKSARALEKKITVVFLDSRGRGLYEAEGEIVQQWSDPATGKRHLNLVIDEESLTEAKRI